MTDRIVDAIEKVMSDPRFHPEPLELTWWQKLQAWAANILEQILTDAGNTLAGVVSTHMVVCGLVVALLAFLFFLYRNWHKRSRPSYLPKKPATIVNTVNNKPFWEQHLEAARCAAPAQAIQHLQYCVVGYADAQQWLIATDWKTHGAYLHECTAPEPFNALMTSIAKVYETTLFAGIEPDAHTVDALLYKVTDACQQGASHA